MGDIGDGVRLLEADVRGLQTVRDRAGPAVRSAKAAAASTSAPALALPCGLLQHREEVLARDRRPGLPFRLDARPVPGTPRLRWRGHAHEVAIADDDHVRHRLGRTGVERCQLRAVRRRTQHLAVPHARESDVRGILVLTVDERAAVDFRHGVAGDGPAIGGRRWGLAGDRLRELATLGERAVGERSLVLAWTILPSATVSSPRLTFQVSAARSMSSSRAAAAARRSCGDMRGWSCCRTCPGRTGSVACRP